MCGLKDVPKTATTEAIVIDWVTTTVVFCVISGHIISDPWEVFQARPVGRRPRVRPRTRWRDYISTLAWERLGIPPSELVNVAREREVWGPLLELLPPRPDPG